MAAVAVNTHIMKIQRIIPKEAAYQPEQSFETELLHLFFQTETYTQWFCSTIAKST